MRAEAVLFDLFGTLLLIEKNKDSHMLCLRKLHEFLVKKGICVSFACFKKVYFEVVDELYAKAANMEEPHFSVRVSRVLQRFGYEFDNSSTIVSECTRVFADEFMRHVRLDDEALYVLRKLHGKYKLGLVSNFAIPECVWKLLDGYGLREFFEVVLISAEVNKRKPSPDVFKRALKILGVDASRAVFVGDTLNPDIKGAKNVGMATILIERRKLFDRIEDIRPERLIKSLRKLFDRIAVVKPDRVARSLRELPVILGDC
jgi:putative hydrolase of the HAD superfamily